MSNYRTEKPCCFCQRNEDELCDKDSEVCGYYKAYQQCRADVINPLNQIIAESEKMMWHSDKTLGKIVEWMKEQNNENIKNNL